MRLIDASKFTLYENLKFSSLNENILVQSEDNKIFSSKPSAFDMKAQQRRLNAFVKEYNNIRPHEALEMKTPAESHSFSTRPFPERITHFDYHHEWKTMKVTQNGAIRW